MPSLPKIYDPAQMESRLYEKWEASGAMRSGARQGAAYAIAMPPPM